MDERIELARPTVAQRGKRPVVSMVVRVELLIIARYYSVPPKISSSPEQSRTAEFLVPLDPTAAL